MCVFLGCSRKADRRVAQLRTEDWALAQLRTEDWALAQLRTEDWALAQLRTLFGSRVGYLQNLLIN